LRRAFNQSKPRLYDMATTTEGGYAKRFVVEMNSHNEPLFEENTKTSILIGIASGEKASVKTLLPTTAMRQTWRARGKPERSLSGTERREDLKSKVGIPA
jgi:hypothetical protein